MANTIQIKRGLNANLPVLTAGELAFSTDTFQLHIGDGTLNHEIIMADLFNAQTILAAVADNTPTALTIPEQSVVGRITAGNVTALTGANLWTILTGQALADVSMNGYKITTLAAPTTAQDAATKAYVDDLVANGLTWHEAVKDKDITYPISSATAWAASTSYAVGDLVEPTTANGYFYKCTTAGTSGSSEPTWSTTIGATVTDNTAVWTCYKLLPSPVSGDRYWIGGTGEGAWASEDYQITEYNGTGWDFEAVTEGDAAFVIDESTVYYYDGTTLKQLYTAIGKKSWVDLDDTPSSITALDIVRGNSAGSALEMVDFATTYLDTAPVSGDTTKGITSDWAYSHNATATGVHGAGTNTLLNSGSVIDGGTF